MARKYIDCREVPGSKCSVALSADNDEDLLEIAMLHGVKSHGFTDDAKTRKMIKEAMQSGCPKCD
jgi:predicted small metal-binding protein